MPGAPVVVYLEDSEGDVLLLEEALAEVAFECDLHVIRDGEAALRYLRIKSAAAGVSMPNLILLGLHLPGADGKEVLAYARTCPHLSRIPTFVFAPPATFDRIHDELGPGHEERVTRPDDWPGYVALARRLKERVAD